MKRCYPVAVERVAAALRCYPCYRVNVRGGSTVSILKNSGFRPLATCYPHFPIGIDFFSLTEKVWGEIKSMNEQKGPYKAPRRRSPAGDPRLDLIESGPMRGRRAVTLGMVKALREDADLLTRELGRIEDKFIRLRLRSIVGTLRILHRVARLPADPATDYRGGGPGGGGDPAAGL